MKTFSTAECQIIWLIGAIERLATLGLVEETPIKLNNEKAIDLFLEIDKSCHVLFKDDYELAQILNHVVKETCEEETDIDVVNALVELLLEYKNNRYKLAQRALELSFNK